jgi:uncharacterized protein
MFVNRLKELRLLKGLYKSKKPNMLLVYGRRRVGKTAILCEFARAKKNKRRGGQFFQ